MALSKATSMARVKNLMKLDPQRLTENIIFPKVLLRAPADT
jgi:hypothetical protein